MVSCARELISLSERFEARFASALPKDNVFPSYFFTIEFGMEMGLMILFDYFLKAFLFLFPSKDYALVLLILSFISLDSYNLYEICWVLKPL